MIIHGRSPDGSYVPLSVDADGGVNAAKKSINTVNFSKEHSSAFGDLIAVPLTPVVQLDFVHGINSQLGSVGTPLNSATGDTNGGRLRLQSGTNSAGAVAFVSSKPARYRQGQGLLARFTPVFSAPQSNNMQLWGMANYTPSASNTAFADGYLVGYYVGTDVTGAVYDGTVFGILHRNSASGSTVDRFYPQNQWDDPLDGTGSSKFNWSEITGVPFEIQWPYLGYGNIFFLIQNPADGEWIHFHTIRYANTSAIVQLGNPNLYFYGLNINSGNTTNVTMYCGSVGVFLTGVREFLGPIFGTGNRKTAITTRISVFTIKAATTYNGVTNRGVIKLKSVSFAWDGANGTGLLDIVKNTTLGGSPSYATISGSTADGGTTITSGQSVVSVDTAGTTVTGGTVLFNAVMSRNTSASMDLLDYDLFLAPGETLTFAVTGDASGDARISCNWVEDV